MNPAGAPLKAKPGICFKLPMGTIGNSGYTKAVSQLLWSDKDREEWFSLGENHEKASRFGLHQLRNRSNGGVEVAHAAV